MTNIQKKLIFGAAGIVVFAIAFYFLGKLSKTEIFCWGAGISFVVCFLIANNNPAVVDSTISKGQNAVK